MLRDLLLMCRERQASDLHLVQGEPPILRIYGKLHRANMAPLNDRQLEHLLVGILSPTQRQQFDQFSDVDFSYALPETDRFRVNVHRQRGGIEGAFRRLPAQVPSLRELGLPMVTHDLTRLSSGLVLITGPVGVGKSTTMAAMVDQINQERSCLVIAIEDPIEYLHANKKAVIKQREITVDTPSFGLALRHALRQDPNVLVIGEMRDLETISIALTAAETGHLVLATLHTPDAVQSLQRIIDVFPEERQSQVRIQLAECLQAVVAQQLLPRAAGPGMVLATEVLLANMAVRNLIREAQYEQIPSVIQMSGKQGMLTMDQSLKRLLDQRLVQREVAKSKAKYPSDF